MAVIQPTDQRGRPLLGQMLRAEAPHGRRKRLVLARHRQSELVRPSLLPPRQTVTRGRHHHPDGAADERDQRQRQQIPGGRRQHPQPHVGHRQCGRQQQRIEQQRLHQVVMLVM